MSPNHRWRWLLLVLLASSGCAKRVAAPSGFGDGLASYYGLGFDGKRTASGELFDRRAFTAAHRTLPFGTCVRVTHRGNGRNVRVRINDRGPFTGGRLIDVSQAAADALEMTTEGVAPVSISPCN